MTRSFAVLCLALCLGLCHGQGQSQEDDEDGGQFQSRMTVEGQPGMHLQPLGYVSRSNFNFTSVMYSALSRSRQDGNLLFSPFSIHSLLVMTAFGARGKTLNEMTTGLALLNQTITAVGYKQVTKSLNSMNSENLVVKVANKIFTGEKVEVNQDFQQYCENFRTEVQRVDFAADPYETINTWVEEETNHRIKDIVQPGTFSDQTVMVLINAIYMKGTWLTEFKPRLTTNRPFHINENEDVTVPTMQVSSTFPYKEIEATGDQVLELPYTGNTMSMIIILPKEKNGTLGVENDIATYGVRRYTRNLEDTTVHVSLPKFRMEISTDLVPILKKMGMRTMFGNEANFSGLLNNDVPVQVSDVKHKVFIEVNEEGTEAAAATMVGIQALSLNYDMTATFKADHPFIFLVFQKEAKQVLFMGRYSVPVQ